MTANAPDAAVAAALPAVAQEDRAGLPPANDAVAAHEGAAGPSVRHTDAKGAEPAPDEEDLTILRIEHLPRDVGWMMVYVGVLGVILPGIIGAPFLVAGIAVLTPNGPKVLSRWVGRKPRGFVRTSLKQISRWLDDLERRYPRLPPAAP